MVRRFKKETYMTDILVEPDDFEVVCFDAPTGGRLRISAWEHDAEAFEIYVLARGNVRGDAYRTDRMMLGNVSTSEFDEDYTFPHAGEFCVVISNARAHSREKLVHLDLAWIHEARDVEQASKSRMKSETPRNSPQRRSESAPEIPLVLVCIVFSALAAYSISGDPVAISAIGLAVGIGSIFASLLKREIRQVIGLEEE